MKRERDENARTSTLAMTNRETQYRVSQKQNILQMLRKARAEGREVEVPELTDARLERSQAVRILANVRHRSL